jgi:hypothetical protein
MITEVAFAAGLWLVITICTPGKVRAFISVLSAGLIGVLLFFSVVLAPRELVVSIPSFGKEKGYDLPYDDFKALAAPKAISGVTKVENAEELSELGKDLITYKDLTEEQLLPLQSLEGFIDFSSGRTGLIPRYVAPMVKEGKLVPGYHGIEFAPLPHYDELRRKSEVIEAIRQIVNEENPNI